MPRVSTKEAESVSKRAPRRQVVRKPSTVSRARKTVIEPENTNETLARKAPTMVATEKKTSFKPSRKIIALSTAFVAVLATAVWIGTSDNGQINVISKIEERNSQIANGEFTADNSSGLNGSQMVPVQSGSPNVPNGGLKGRGVGSTNAAQQAAVVTASTTEATASSTEATSTEAVEGTETQPATTPAENTVTESNSEKPAENVSTDDSSVAVPQNQ